jgi:hypothetical protein
VSTPNKYEPSTNTGLVPPPHCPHCSTQLDEVGFYQWTAQISMGLTVMLCMYCPNEECRKILGTNILLAPMAKEQSSIVGPH